MDGGKSGVAWLASILFFLVCESFIGSGCINIGMHIDGDGEIYGGTRENCETISEAIAPRPELHWGNQGEAEIAHAYALLFLPVLIIDLPLEVAADTVTLPFDIVKACTEKEREESSGLVP